MKTAVLAIIALFLTATVYATEKNQSAATTLHTKHYENSLFKMTDKGLFSVEVVIKEKDLKIGVNAFDIIVHDNNDKDVVGATITVVPWMPEMGHGVFEKPVIKERGGGLYSVENITLIMGGRWELKMKIRKGTLEDTTTFDFPDVKNIGQNPFFSFDEKRPWLCHSSCDLLSVEKFSATGEVFFFGL